MAYPDRIAQRRSGSVGRYVLRNGLGAHLDPQGLSREDYLVVLELDGQVPESRIYLAAPLSLDELRSWFGDAITMEESVEWDPAVRAVLARRREWLGAIVLREAALGGPDPALVLAAMVEGVRREGIDVLPWDDGAGRTRQRITFVRARIRYGPMSPTRPCWARSSRGWVRGWPAWAGWSS